MARTVRLGAGVIPPYAPATPPPPPPGLPAIRSNTKPVGNEIIGQGGDPARLERVMAVIAGNARKMD